MEDELVAHFVVPLLRALGWPPERIAIKWRYIDVALLAALPRIPQNCHLVIEAKRPLLVDDEAEISEVIRQRLFENLGSDRIRRNVAKAYADWCFERRAQLPPEWTAVDTSATEKKAREFLQGRFEACYPFHPATLSVFIASGCRCHSSRRPVARWPCWLSGFRGRFASRMSRHVASR